MNIQELLNNCRQIDCSDLHLSVGLPFTVRINGSLRPLNNDPLVEQQVFDLIHSMMSDAQIKQYQKSDVDFSFQDNQGFRYRINAYHQQSHPCAAIRLLRNSIPNLQDLLLPEVVERLTTLPRGLILVTGPTGSGKSTSMAAMINQINITRQAHIITVEDPIEYVFAHGQCMIHQREVGRDTEGFAYSLRSALREDPDVILVGEMRDLETIQAALTAAETGHLVISTLHTNSAVATVDRIIDVFPQHQQQQVRIQLSAVLQGIITQQLLPKVGGLGRVAAHEILIMNDAIASLIRENKCHQINNVIQTNAKVGMQLMDMSLANLVKNGIIDLSVAEKQCSRLDTLKQFLMF